MHSAMNDSDVLGSLKSVRGEDNYLSLVIVINKKVFNCIKVAKKFNNKITIIMKTKEPISAIT